MSSQASAGKNIEDELGLTGSAEEQAHIAKMQAAQRGKIARRDVAEMKGRKIEQELGLTGSEDEAAQIAKMQATVRGKKDRARVADLKTQKAGADAEASSAGLANFRNVVNMRARRHVAIFQTVSAAVAAEVDCKLTSNQPLLVVSAADSDRLFVLAADDSGDEGPSWLKQSQSQAQALAAHLAEHDDVEVA